MSEILTQVTRRHAIPAELAMPRHPAAHAASAPAIALRRPAPCRRAGPAAVPVIPAKWCGDTIAHTRKLRF